MKIYNYLTFIFCILILTFICNRSVGFAVTPSLEEVVEKVQKNYENLKDLKADFTQIAYNNMFDQTEKAEGKQILRGWR